MERGRERESFFDRPVRREQSELAMVVALRALMCAHLKLSTVGHCGNRSVFTAVTRAMAPITKEATGRANAKCLLETIAKMANCHN